MEAKTIAGVLIFIVTVGGVVYWLRLPQAGELTKDICTAGGVNGIWTNTSKLYYYNETYPAIGQYHCALENTTQWCYKLSSTGFTCYLLYDLEPFIETPTIPSVQASGITFQPPSWQINNTMTGITKYLDIEISELPPKCTFKYERFNCTDNSQYNYQFEISITNYTEFSKYYILTDLQNLKNQIKNLTQNVKVSNMTVDTANKKLSFVVSGVYLNKTFLYEKFQIGSGTININTAGNSITMVGDADYGNCEDSTNGDYSLANLYAIDNANNFTLKGQTKIWKSVRFSLTYQPRVAEQVAIPIVFNITNYTASTPLSYCNITGTIWNGSTSFTENVTFSTNGTYETKNYFKSVITNGIGCGAGDSTQGTFNVTVQQKKWGAIGRDPKNNYQYFTIASFVVGDGATATCFSDTNKQWYINDCSGSYCITVKGFAFFTLGSLVDETNKRGSNGVSIYRESSVNLLSAEANSNLYVYSSYISSTGYMSLFGDINRFWEVAFGSATFGSSTVGSANVDLYRITLAGGADLFSQAVTGATVDDVIMYTGRIWAGGTVNVNATMSNIRLIGDTQTIGSTAWNGTLKLIDSYSDSWNMQIIGITRTGTAYRQNTLEFYIIDKDSNPLVAGINIIHSCLPDYWSVIPSKYSTTADGSGYASFTITKEYYNATTTDGAPYDCNPHIFTISKSGYETLNFTANITEKTKWTLSLKNETKFGTELAEAAWNFITRDIHGTITSGGVECPEPYKRYCEWIWNYTYRYTTGEIS